MAESIRFYRRIALLILAMALQGCENKLDSLAAEIRGKNTTISLLKYVPLHPESAAATKSSALQASAAPASATKWVAVKAIADVDASYRTFRNDSYGKVTGQVTVAYNSVIGMVDGQSQGFLEFRQPEANPTAHRLSIGAVYDATINGLRAQVADLDGQVLGTPIPFNDISEVDLRIERTATDLIFSARATPQDQSAGGWTPVYTLAAAPDPAAFHLYIGIRKVQKKGLFFFSNFALDGDAIGGTREYPILANVRASVEAIRRAQSKIKSETPDLPGALADLDAAITAHDTALTDAKTSLSFLQSKLSGKQAVKTLEAYTDDLAAARTAVATNDAKKAAAQSAKLDTTAGALLSAMANLLGMPAPNLKTAPPLFFLRIP